MDVISAPEALYCSECGDEIDGPGYLPAAEREEGYAPMVNAAVCDACGFKEVGMMGCAPELEEVVDPAPDDVLLYVRTTDEGIEVVSSKD